MMRQASVPRIIILLKQLLTPRHFLPDDNICKVTSRGIKQYNITGGTVPKVIHESEDRYKIDGEFVGPDFIPKRGRRSHLLHHLERKDMLRRRSKMEIPEFYPGSIVAVTVADRYSPRNSSRFVGLCLQRHGSGLGSTFVLRNVIDGLGVEINYELYNPKIQKIEVLKLEKHVDENLIYMRDALPQYCTIDPEMPKIIHPEGLPVPVNTTKVELKPRPWSRKWHIYKIDGIEFPDLTEREAKERSKEMRPAEWAEMDINRHYHVPAEIKEIIKHEITGEETEYVDPLKKINIKIPLRE